MNLLELFAPVRTFVLDIDGVLTDGSLLLTDDGHMLRSMNIRDGYALQLAISKGYNVWAISGSRSEGVSNRLKSLGVTEVYMGVTDKATLLNALVLEHGAHHDTLLYMGDDIPDHAAMQLCALPCCPNDAAPEIRTISKYISPLPGGKGCVRDVIEKVLKLNGHWALP